MKRTIKSVKGTAKPTNYSHYFEDGIARLLQLGQGMTISIGSRLEAEIANNVSKSSKIYKVADADSKERKVFLYGENLNSLGIKLKKNQKKTDFVLIDKDRKVITVIELKSGSMLDTAKATGEKEYLEMYRKAISASPKYKGYRVDTKFCAFSAETIDPTLYKNKFNADEIITGSDFCKMVGISMKPIQKFLESSKVENTRKWVDCTVATLKEAGYIRK